MQAHEGVEDEEGGLERRHGGGQALLIGGEVQPQAGCGDHLDVEVGEGDAGGTPDALEPGADDRERILGGEEEDTAGADDGEAAQTRHAGGDGDGHVEGEQRFAAFRFAPDDPDRLVAPEAVDEPAAGLGVRRQRVGGLHGQERHRARPVRAGGGATRGLSVGGAKTSR